MDTTKRRSHSLGPPTVIKVLDPAELLQREEDCIQATKLDERKTQSISRWYTELEEDTKQKEALKTKKLILLTEGVKTKENQCIWVVFGLDPLKAVNKQYLSDATLKDIATRRDDYVVPEMIPAEHNKETGKEDKKANKADIKYNKLIVFSANSDDDEEDRWVYCSKDSFHPVLDDNFMQAKLTKVLRKTQVKQMATSGKMDLTYYIFAKIQNDYPRQMLDKDILPIIRAEWEKHCSKEDQWNNKLSDIYAKMVNETKLPSRVLTGWTYSEAPRKLTRTSARLKDVPPPSETESEEAKKRDQNDSMLLNSSMDGPSGSDDTRDEENNQGEGDTDADTLPLYEERGGNGTKKQGSNSNSEEEEEEQEQDGEEAEVVPSREHSPKTSKKTVYHNRKSKEEWPYVSGMRAYTKEEYDGILELDTMPEKEVLKNIAKNSIAIQHTEKNMRKLLASDKTNSAKIGELERLIKDIAKRQDDITEKQEDILGYLKQLLDKEPAEPEETAKYQVQLEMKIPFKSEAIIEDFFKADEHYEIRKKALETHLLETVRPLVQQKKTTAQLASTIMDNLLSEKMAYYHNWGHSKKDHGGFPPIPSKLHEWFNVFYKGRMAKVTKVGHDDFMRAVRLTFKLRRSAIDRKILSGQPVDFEVPAPEQLEQTKTRRKRSQPSQKIKQMCKKKKKMSKPTDAEGEEDSASESREERNKLPDASKAKRVSTPGTPSERETEEAEESDSSYPEEDD